MKHMPASGVHRFTNNLHSGCDTPPYVSVARSGALRLLQTEVRVTDWDVDTGS